MRKARLTLICPTIDRTSVKRLLDLVVPQLAEGDEFILVGDGPCPRARAWAKGLPRVVYFELRKRVGDFGCTPCDRAIARAKGDYIFLIGDDDVPADDAFKAVRAGVSWDDPKKRRLHIFSMYHGSQGIVLGGTLRPGFVSGQQIVFPNDKKKIVKMAAFDREIGSTDYSDWQFIARMADLYGGEVTHHKKIICHLPAQNVGAMF